MNVIDEAEESVRRYERMLPRERADRLKRSGIEVLASQGRRDRELGLRVRYDVEICCLQAIRIKRRDTSGMGERKNVCWIVKRHQRYSNALNGLPSKHCIRLDWITAL